MVSRSPIFPSHVATGARLVEFAGSLFIPQSRPADLRHPESVLVVEPFGLGDCVLLNGMIGALRQAWPTTVVHVLCRPEWAWLFSALADVKVHAARLPWVVRSAQGGEGWQAVLELVSHLRKAHITVGFDVRGDVRSQLLLALARCTERIGATVYGGSNVTLRGSLLTRRVEYRHEHRLQQNLRLLEAAGIASPVASFSFPKVATPSNQFAIAVHPGAGWKFKQWQPARWAKLIDRLFATYGGPIQLLAHATEKEPAEAILSLTRAPLTLTVCSALPSLAEALRASQCYVGLDSGALHLAAAMDIPSVGLYGPGTVELFYPLSRRAAMVTRQQDFACAPCLLRTCVRPDSTCMDAITVDSVFAACRQVFLSASAR